MPVGEGKDRVEFHLPPGFRDRMRTLRSKLRGAYGERMGRAGQEDGMFLDWLVSRAEEWFAWRDEAREELEQAQAARADAEDALEEAQRQVETQAVQARGEAAEAIRAADDARRQLALSDAARGIVEVAVEQGIPAVVVVDVARAILTSGMIPERVADTIRQCGGLARVLSALEAQAAEVRDELDDLHTARDRARGEAQRATEQAADLLRKVARLKGHADSAEHAARLLGLRIEWLTQRIREASEGPIPGVAALPHAVRVVLAGLLLLADPEDGDPQVTIPAGPGHPMPVRVLLSDLARTLAPSEAIRAQEREAIERAIQVQAVADGRIPATALRRAGGGGVSSMLDGRGDLPGVDSPGADAEGDPWGDLAAGG